MADHKGNGHDKPPSQDDFSELREFDWQMTIKGKMLALDKDFVKMRVLSSVTLTTDLLRDQPVFGLVVNPASNIVVPECGQVPPNLRGTKGG